MAFSAGLLCSSRLQYCTPCLVGVQVKGEPNSLIGDIADPAAAARFVTKSFDCTHLLFF